MVAANHVSRIPRSLQHISTPPVPRITRSRRVLRALDAFLRRRDTWLARGLSKLSPSTSASYTASTAKRTLDLLVCVPLAVIAILLIVLLTIANKLLYPHHSALFRQDRVGRGGTPLRVVKIRSMMPEPSPAAAWECAPRCTGFGRFMRRYYLDELPQLLQVLTGRLSLVGVRVLPRDVHDSLAGGWSKQRFEAWRTMYAAAPLGLTGAHQVFRRTGKEDGRRFHRDMFYARHATLGFDLYLLLRTLGTRDRHPVSPALLAHRPCNVNRSLPGDLPFEPQAHLAVLPDQHVA